MKRFASMGFCACAALLIGGALHAQTTGAASTETKPPPPKQAPPKHAPRHHSAARAHKPVGAGASSAIDDPDPGTIQQPQ